MKTLTGKRMCAVWKTDSLTFIRLVAAFTRDGATAFYRELYNLSPEEVTSLKLTRVKGVWSLKEGVIN